MWKGLVQTLGSGTGLDTDYVENNKSMLLVPHTGSYSGGHSSSLNSIASLVATLNFLSKSFMSFFNTASVKDSKDEKKLMYLSGPSVCFIRN